VLRCFTDDRFGSKADSQQFVTPAAGFGHKRTFLDSTNYGESQAVFPMHRVLANCELRHTSTTAHSLD